MSIKELVMRPINKLLSLFGLQLSRSQNIPRKFIANYEYSLEEVKKLRESGDRRGKPERNS
jgi:hypothetical protein